MRVVPLALCWGLTFHLQPLAKVNQMLAKPLMAGVTFQRFVPDQIHRKLGRSQRYGVRFQAKVIFIQMRHAAWQRADHVMACAAMSCASSPWATWSSDAVSII